MASPGQVPCPPGPHTHMFSFGAMGMAKVWIPAGAGAGAGEGGVRGLGVEGGRDGGLPCVVLLPEMVGSEEGALRRLPGMT